MNQEFENFSIRPIEQEDSEKYFQFIEKIGRGLRDIFLEHYHGIRMLKLPGYLLLSSSP